MQAEPVDTADLTASFLSHQVCVCVFVSTPDIAAAATLSCAKVLQQRLSQELSPCMWWFACLAGPVVISAVAVVQAEKDVAQ